MYYVITSNELYHHGIKGQKWGVRRYQNPDGTLTEAGRKRYGYTDLEKVAKSKTSFGAAWRSDRAATKRANRTVMDNLKGKSFKEKMKDTFGYTGAAKKQEIARDAYKEASNKLEKAGRTKDAILMAATAANNKQIAKQSREVAEAKGVLDRLAKEYVYGYNIEQYSKAGRSYISQNENLKNAFTFGIYGLAADRKYSKAYSESERLSKLKNVY